MADYSSGSIVYEMGLDAKGLFEGADKAKAKLAEMQSSGDKAAKGLDKIDKSAQGAGDSLGKLTTVAKAVSAALLSSKIIAYAESWNELEDRIQNTGATASQTKDILDKLTTTSNRNGRKINETAELYIRLSNSMKEAGRSTNDTLGYIDALSNLMTINKTNPIKAEAAINALTKAQVKGKLAGVEAMSVFNAMPSILKTLVTQLNKTESEVRELANNGKLSMQQFTDAMIAAQDETAALADNMRNNTGDAINRIENNLKRFFGELNNSTGATKILVDSLILVSDNVDVVITAVSVLSAIYAGRYLTSITAAGFATLKQAANNLRVASSAGIASVAMKGLSATMNLLGGPAGILLMATGALVSWSLSSETAKQSAIDLKNNIGDLTESFKQMNDIQREAAKIKLDEKIIEQSKKYDVATKKVNDFIQAEEDAAAKFKVAGKGERFQKQLKLLQAEQDSILQGLDGLKKTRDEYNNISTVTTKATSSIQKLNEALTKDTTDSITQKLSKLNQELEISQLKQSKLNKEAYVYQNVLATLGDDASTYQSALFEAAQTGKLFKGSIEGLPKEVYPLIESLSQLYDINESGANKTNNASTKIKELKDNIAVAKLEVQGFLDKARELKALQDAKSTNGTQDEINQIVALTKEYEKLELAKTGKSFAQEQVNNGLSEAQKIALEQQAKLEELNKWHATGLANQQLYEDAKNAIVEDANKRRKQLQDQNTSLILSSSSALFDGLAGLTEAFSGKQNAAYRTMFAISKGFALANAALNLQVAISNAQKLDPPASYAAMAEAASAGGQIVSTISSMSYGGGRELGGAVSQNAYYRVGEGNKPEILQSGGRQYLIPGENGKVISNKNVTNGGSSINMSFNTSINLDSSSTTEQDGQQLAKGLESVMREFLQKELTRSGGLLNKR